MSFSQVCLSFAALVALTLPTWAYASPAAEIDNFTEAAFWVAGYGQEAGAWRVNEHPRFLADVNEDGKQDVVGFGDAGVYVSLSTGASFTEAVLWVAGYGQESGAWRVDEHPRFVADVDGDGKQDVVGFGDAGVYVSLSTGSSFTDAAFWVAGYGQESGAWRVNEHPRFLADVNGDGKQDVVGFGDAGVYVSLSTGANFADAAFWVAGYGQESGAWRVDEHPRFLADVNGDGKQDVVGFGDNGVYVSLSTGAGFSEAELWVAGYGQESGAWRVNKHPRFLADVNGDGKQDVVGYGDAGVYVSLSTGAGFAEAELWVAGYGQESGAWRVDEHPRFLADVNGDGKQDVVGFGDAGVYVSLSTGAGFAEAELWVAGYGQESGAWRVNEHPRFLADVNGDRSLDVVGYGDAGVYVSLSDAITYYTYLPAVMK